MPALALSRHYDPYSEQNERFARKDARIELTLAAAVIGHIPDTFTVQADYTSAATLTAIELSVRFLCDRFALDFEPFKDRIEEFARTRDEGLFEAGAALWDHLADDLNIAFEAQQHALRDEDWGDPTYKAFQHAIATWVTTSDKLTGLSQQTKLAEAG